LLVWLLLFWVKITRTKSPFWSSSWFDLWGGNRNLVRIFVVDFHSSKSFFSFISPPICNWRSPFIAIILLLTVYCTCFDWLDSQILRWRRIMLLFLHTHWKIYLAYIIYLNPSSQIQTCSFSRGKLHVW
jgi:hypothetical protein